MRSKKTQSIYASHLQAKQEMATPAAPAAQTPQVPAPAQTTSPSPTMEATPSRARQRPDPNAQFRQDTPFSKFLNTKRPTVRKLKGMTRPNEYGEGYGEDRLY